MSLKQQILDDVKTAMKAGDKDRLGVLRMLTAAFKQREVDERIELTDTDSLAIVEKLIKQRRESARMYRDGGREELAAKEEAEIGILETYLPAQLGDAEIDTMIAEAIAATGASEMKDMGKVMGVLKPKMQGKADMSAVSARIKARLGA